MSKIRRKQGKEDEYFKGQIRKLESENRSLKKKLRALERREHLYEDMVEAVAEEIKVQDSSCKKCKVGVLVPVDLKHVKYLVCTEPTCRDRKKV